MDVKTLPNYVLLSREMGGFFTKLVARLLPVAAIWVRIQTSLKNTKWATKSKGVPNTLARKKNID
jgi:hypothetical protein